MSFCFVFITIALFQFDVCLFKNGFQRAWGNIFIRVADGYASFLGRMFELMMTADAVHFIPAVLFQDFYNFFRRIASPYKIIKNINMMSKK